MPPATVRLRRLAEQRGWSAKEVEARESAQMSLTEKVSRADDVVDNSGPPGDAGPAGGRPLLQPMGHRLLDVHVER